MDTTEANRTIDLRDQVCPMTFVRARLALDGLFPGETLLILLSGAEPQARVPLTITRQGHKIVTTTIARNGDMHLLVRKGGTPA